LNLRVEIRYPVPRLAASLPPSNSPAARSKLLAEFLRAAGFNSSKLRYDGGVEKAKTRRLLL